jgi:hypothetical protein
MPKQKKSDKSVSITWWEAWRTALTRPDVVTFESMARNSSITMLRAFSWVTTGWIIAMFLTYVNMTVYASDLPSSSSLILICLGVLLLPIEFTMLGITHAVAGFFDGVGKFDELIRPVAAFLAPIMIISSVIDLIPIPVLRYASYGLSVYQVGLIILSVKAVHRIGWYKATVSSLIFVLLELLYLGSGLGFTV